MMKQRLATRIMSGPHYSETLIFILAEMLKGRKLRFFDSFEVGPRNRGRKCQEYYVGEIKVNGHAAINAIKRGLVKSIDDGRYEITRKGRKVYGRGHEGKG